jgi:hypothetical protein
MYLDTRLLYSDRRERLRFEARLLEFLKVDTCADVISYYDGVVSYLTESVVPTKLDSRPPLLLLFGNPAPESVRRKCFFAGEKNRPEHRFWRALRESGIMSFDECARDSDSSRTQALFDLTYTSPFRVGLAVFYSMPSPASDPKWSGVAGLRRLFGTRALREIAECEKGRVERLIREFTLIQPGGAVVAFQKDAYFGVKDSDRPENTILTEKRLSVVESRCLHSNLKLFRMPATRYMAAPCYFRFMGEVTERLHLPSTPITPPNKGNFY